MEEACQTFDRPSSRSDIKLEDDAAFQKEREGHRDAMRPLFAAPRLVRLRAREGSEATYWPGTTGASVCLVFLSSLEVIIGPY